MKTCGLRLTVYSASHFGVDLCCALLLFRIFGRVQDAAALFLLYNYCAFALQMPLGLIADRLGRGAHPAAAGCLLVALSFALSAFPFPAASLAGLGNALFHVGGGVDVMRDSRGRASPLGVYVSPGAAGLYLGTLLGKGTLPLWIGAALCPASALGILCFASGRQDSREEAPPLSFRGLGRAQGFLPALCLFAVVVLRSYAGMTMSFAWKREGLWGLCALAAVVLGKTAGGFAMDLLGGRRASLLTLLLSALLFCLADHPLAGVAAIFLFNMSMPMTLCALSRRMPSCWGFSFGLLTFALYLGFLPVGLGLSGTASCPLLCAICLLSALLMGPGMRGEGNHAR